MKNDLTCGVVRDLLPPFVEGLTSEETNGAVERHLAACPDCARLRADMAAPPEAAEQSREVDYLKRVKRRNGRRVVLAVVCTVLLFLAGLALKIFYIGTQAQEQGLAVLSAQVDGDNMLHLHISTPWSGTAYHSWKAEQTGGRVDIWARQVAASPLCRDGSADLGISLSGVEEVRLCGRTVWQDGTAIQRETFLLYQTQTAYVGDAPALGRVADALNIPGQCGGYHTSLQTASRPYGWTLEFSDTYTEKQAAQLDAVMENTMSPLMLALVDNLDQVTWTYATGSALQTRTVTAAEASLRWAEGGSIKDCAASPAALQRLRDRLSEQ